MMIMNRKLQSNVTLGMYTFNIADFYIKVEFEPSDRNSILLLPSFRNFMVDNDSDDGRILFSLTVKKSMALLADRCESGCYDTGNGKIIVFDLPDGGHQYIFTDIYGKSCCLLTTNEDFTVCQCALSGDGQQRTFGLNNALMLVFAFAGCHHKALLLHASCVVCDGRAYPFIAMSGTGKSTHSNLWLQNVEDTELLNDDNPAVRIVDGTVMVYGTPWSGKTPCYRRRCYPLGAITRIERSSVNNIIRMDNLHAFAALLPACSSMKCDETLHGMMCDILSMVIDHTRVYTMYCLPDNEAALVCSKEITGGN